MWCLGAASGSTSAACIAGVMKVEDGLRLVAARQRLPSTVAAVAGGNAVADDSAEELDAFEELADRIDYFPADRPLICELTGKVVPVHRLLGGSYWRRHCEQESRFR